MIVENNNKLTIDMKTIKLQLLILLIPICINLCAQDIQRFLGTYHLEGMCKDISQEGNIFPDERDVIIKEGIESDLLINIGASTGFNSFKTFVSEDSLSIPIQWWENFDETQASFQGKGKIKNDSLFLYYKTGGTFGAFECECKGKKVNLSGIVHSYRANENGIYFDMAKQVIAIPESMQNKSLIIELIGLQGNVILKETITDEFMSLAYLQRGIYLYRILQNGQIVYLDKLFK